MCQSLQEPYNPPDTSPLSGTMFVMGFKKSLAIIPLAVFAVVAFSVFLAVTLSSSDSSSTGTTQNPTISSDIPSLSQSPAVARLESGNVLISHTTASAKTEFGPGVLIVSLPVESGGFRWVSGPAPVSGGRVDPTSKMLAQIPANLPVVLSYDSKDTRVSVFARLFEAPVLIDGMVQYKLSLFDAPGRDSTYTVSGSYDIPENLPSPSLVISGQVLPVSTDS